jgi:hypothetical protein
VVAALACGRPLAAQSTSGKDLATGKFLVASRGLLDPNFAETVVLLVEYQESGVVGLVVNRRTKFPVSRALSVDEAKGRQEPVYIGGPVEMAGVMALARSSADCGQRFPRLPGLRRLERPATSQRAGPRRLVYCSRRLRDGLRWRPRFGVEPADRKNRHPHGDVPPSPLCPKMNSTWLPRPARR